VVLGHNFGLLVTRSQSEGATLVLSGIQHKGLFTFSPDGVASSQISQERLRLVLEAREYAVLPIMHDPDVRPLWM
jgi:hypothetical protein